jgi:acetyl-CoA C-acetyltransferase
MTTTMLVMDKATGETSSKEVTLSKDEGNRADTTLEGLKSLKPVFGSARRSSRASSSPPAMRPSCRTAPRPRVIMEAGEAVRHGLQPLGAYRGMVVAGCEPDEMGIGPVYAVPKLLKRHGLTMDDIGIWELNEAFAVQVLYCADTLGIPMEKPERLGRRHLDRPPLRHVGRPDDRPRPDRGQASRRQIRRGHHVHRRRQGAAGLFEIY